MAEETYSTDGPICPYCGKEHKPDEGFMFSEDYDEQECYGCGETFKVFVYVLHSWTCRKIEEASDA